jgi:diguanylate cyclase
LWYSHIRRQATAASPGNSATAAEAAIRVHKLATQAAFDYMVRLHELATQVAFDVGEHNSQVQELNQELASSKKHDWAEVLGVVVKLVEANQHMQEKLTSTEQKLHNQTDQMQTLLAETRTDALTLLANRRAFDDELVKRFAEFRRQGRTFALTVVDVDHFKNFNDTHGHRAGDEVLRHVAKVLRRKMRETDMVARYGGEEFAIIHPGTGMADACKSAVRACEAIENHQFVHEGKSFRVTVSLGVAEVRSNESAIETLKRADSAMYASKSDGRNCVHFHDGAAFRRVGGDGEPIHSSSDTQPPRETVQSQFEEAENPKPAQDLEAKPRTQNAAEFEMLLDLPGRTRFCQQVRNRMAEWKRGGAGFSVVLLKASNGNECGDDSDQSAPELASRLIAKCLVATTREMDVLGTYTPGCFALMMPTAGLIDALRVTERLLESLAQHIALASDKQPTINMRVGIVQARETDDVTSVLTRAEMALDAAGRKAGNQVYCHNGERVMPASEVLETSMSLA